MKRLLVTFQEILTTLRYVSDHYIPTIDLIPNQMQRNGQDTSPLNPRKEQAGHGRHVTQHFLSYIQQPGS